MSDSMYNVHKYWTYRMYIVCIYDIHVWDCFCEKGPNACIFKI